MAFKENLLKLTVTLRLQKKNKYYKNVNFLILFLSQ